MHEEFQVRVVTSWSSEHHVGLSFSIAITCGHPGNPAHGLTNGSEFNLNDVVNFTCGPGYLLQGASRAQCRSNGQWSSPLPTCRGRRGPSQRGHHTPGGPSAWSEGFCTRFPRGAITFLRTMRKSLHGLWSLARYSVAEPWDSMLQRLLPFTLLLA